MKVVFDVFHSSGLTLLFHPLPDFCEALSDIHVGNISHKATSNKQTLQVEHLIVP